ncbi:MAG: hypothetical protein WD023_12370 [Ilumatobacteraceae bacterium]
MRQFFTWGFWASILAVAALFAGLVALMGRNDAGAGDLQDLVPADVVLGPPVREVDLVASIFLVQADPGFAIVEGRANGAMQIRIDGQRYMNIPAGAPGENRCAGLDQLAQCAVAADLLGDAVLWFSIVPLGGRNSVELPAVTEILSSNRARLANGWIVTRADTLKRNCDEDTNSTTDFIRRFGTDASSTFSIDEQRLVSVTCAPPVVLPPG